MLVRFIAALNTLNTPWLAIGVIALGMVFDIVCKKYGVTSDAANQVIGAGIGLLTGQAIHSAASTLKDPAVSSETADGTQKEKP